MAMLEVKVDGLALDMTTNSPVVILAAKETNKVLPIWIGHAEAWAIAMELSGVGAKRPMTHDLLANIIENLGATIEKIVINDLRQHTFFARIHLSMNGRTIEIDSRPSDAIALCAATKAPIFVAEHVFEQTAQ